MSTASQALADAAGLTTEQRAQAWYNSLGQTAQLHNQDAISAYNNAAKAAALSTSDGFPTQPPAPPLLWRPNYAGVLAAQSYGGTDQAVIDANQSFSALFITFPYVPVAPAPAAPPALSLGPADPFVPGVFQMLGDSSKYPVGFVANVGGQEYQKLAVGQLPMGPEYGWQQIKAN